MQKLGIMESNCILLIFSVLKACLSNRVDIDSSPQQRSRAQWISRVGRRIKDHLYSMYPFSMKITIFNFVKSMESCHLQTIILLSKVELLSNCFYSYLLQPIVLNFYYDHFKIKILKQNQIFFKIYKQKKLFQSK